MPNPLTAFAIPEPMDPTDIVDFLVTLTQDGDAIQAKFPILEAGEKVASFTLALTPEAAAAGLTIKQDDTYPGPALYGVRIVFWLGVDPSQAANSAFLGGLTLGLELTILTTNTPPRRKQRTVTVRVVQQ